MANEPTDYSNLKAGQRWGYDYDEETPLYRHIRVIKNGKVYYDLRDAERIIADREMDISEFIRTLRQLDARLTSGEEVDVSLRDGDDHILRLAQKRLDEECEGFDRVPQLTRRMVRAVLEAGADALMEGSTLTANILRLWDRERIERFALHLLGDEWQAKADNRELDEIHSALAHSEDEEATPLEQVNRLLEDFAALEAENAALRTTVARMESERTEAIKRAESAESELHEADSFIERLRDETGIAEDIATVVKRLKAALETIAHDHKHHSQLVDKDWSVVLGWAQDVAKFALNEVPASSPIFAEIFDYEFWLSQARRQHLADQKEIQEWRDRCEEKEREACDIRGERNAFKNELKEGKAILVANGYEENELPFMLENVIDIMKETQTAMLSQEPTGLALAAARAATGEQLYRAALLGACAVHNACEDYLRSIDQPLSAIGLRKRIDAGEMAANAIAPTIRALGEEKDTP